MVEVKMLNEKGLSHNEVMDKLKYVEKRDGKLNFRAEKTKGYLNLFTKLKSKEANDLKKELEGLDIPRLRDKQIVKLVDLLPQDMDSLKVVLSGEALNLKAEDLKKIIDVTKKY
ncbi:hypothetical protein HY643_03420 [Candidatus Woesearchaeota archaeon]|nr:hypothetical protein [Candidatus Woesearchaeota archaeon]